MFPARVQITSLPHAAFSNADAFNQKLCGDWVAKSDLQSSTFDGAGGGSIAASTTACTDCTCAAHGTAATGTACTTDGAQICGSCNTGYTLDPITASCEPPPCEPHCDVCSDPTTCTTCSTNYFLNNTRCAPSVCTTPSPTSTPAAGYTLSGQTGDVTLQNFAVRGLACAAGYGGTVVATRCTVHNTAYSVGGCTPCSTGKYQHLNTAANTTVACQTCSKGKAFVNKTVACASCSNGQYQDQIGVVAVQCKACSIGKYSDAGESQTTESVCQPCAAGAYENTTASTECKACAAGRYSDAGESQTTGSVCKPCGAGRQQRQ